MRPYQQERSREPQQPPRYKSNTSEAVENSDDEAQILADQDDTEAIEFGGRDAAGETATDLEAPAEFVHGNVDVKEQMDRTTRRAEDAFNHVAANGGTAKI